MILALCSKKLNHVYSAIEIEALAATMALSLAMEIGINSAVLEGDSLVLIKTLKEDVCSLSPFGVLVKDVRVMSLFLIICFTLTLREKETLMLIVWLDMPLAF